ncbi:hypothetical protein AUK45_03905 [Candidatus Peregrinibacteria bacterium CG2_30_44_17]|nr:MAG: hypothetical protein AUK45_03905 [Candidatus Peregrinibacteria bacterium CG2_30_44_17]
MEDIAEAIFLFAIFILPLQIFTIVSQPDIYLAGQANQFNNAAIYLSDILVILSAVLFLPFQKKINTGNRMHLGLLCILGALIAFHSSVAIEWVVFKIATLFLLYILIKNGIAKKSRISGVFMISMALQAAASIGQFVSQDSLGLSLLGEPNLASSGIAKIDMGEDKIIRSYGTMPHPNILAGFMVVAIILNMKFKKRLPLIALCIVGLTLTFSRSGIGALILVGFIYAIFNIKKISSSKRMMTILIGICVIPVVVALPYLKTHFLSTTEIEARLSQLQPAVEMILDNPMGVGFANFTNYVQDYSDDKISPWEYQPVHNVYLLATAELGIIGISVILFILFNVLLSGKSKRIKYSILALAVIGLVDHYMYTTTQGQILAVLLLSMQVASRQSHDVLGGIQK